MVDYKSLVMTWYTRAVSEDYFSKFVFLYLAFVALLRKEFFVDVKTDKEAISRLKDSVKIRDKYFHHAQTNDIEFYPKLASLTKILSNEPLINETKNCSVVITDNADWENIVEFFYTVRNNLFHGNKNPEDLRDGDMVRRAYYLLRPLVEVMLSFYPSTLVIDGPDLKKIGDIDDSRGE